MWPYLDYCVCTCICVSCVVLWLFTLFLSLLCHLCQVTCCIMIVLCYTVCLCVCVSDPSLYKLPQLAYLLVVFFSKDSKSVCWCELVITAPTKPIAIPRLEILSALLLSRLIYSITKALEQEVLLSTPQCCTDSMVSLYWVLGTDKSWRPFIQNRVEEIRKLLPPDNWFHCAGKNKPADLLSRGLTLAQLSQSQLWLEGLEWLKTNKLPEKMEFQMPEECQLEIKKAKREMLWYFFRSWDYM